MPSLLARILLFLSSYVPLTLIFFVLWIDTNPIIATIALIIGAVSLIALVYFIRKVDTIAGTSVQVKKNQRRNDDAMSYIFSYIIPFLAIPSTDWRHAIALLIFFLMLGFLYVNSNMIHVNPTLNLLRYHVYEVTLGDGTTRTLVTKRKRLVSDERIKVTAAGDDILFEKRTED